ncbi:MAG: FtsX-like permease family protein [Clostridiales bacterium]|nr:FtsX-like permease family protein [Clostridiales bacterium]
MNKDFFAKLAFSNIKKNKSAYTPYLITCIITTAMFYIMKSLSLNPGLEKIIGGETIVTILFLGSIIIAVFAFLFLFYTNSFLLKRRKKEFGVFNILGMEKRHIAATLAYETLYTALISISAGLVLGIVLDKLMVLLISKIINTQATFGFFVSLKAIYTTLALFAAIFALIYINSVVQINVSKPIDLLKGSSTGEKEPKTKWLLAVLGFICTGTGYYLAISTKDPVASIFIFFIAVLLVIAGTYMLLTSGSIAILKALNN